MVLLNNDSVQILFVDKGIIRVLDKSLKNLISIPQNSDRDDLILGLIIMIANLFSDYGSSDYICDKMLKESRILETLFEELTFQADISLLKFLSRDLGCILANLSETDDLWCVNRLLQIGIMESAFHLARIFKDKSTTVSSCIEAIKNFAYLF